MKIDIHQLEFHQTPKTPFSISRLDMFHNLEGFIASSFYYLAILGLKKVQRLSFQEMENL